MLSNGTNMVLTAFYKLWGYWRTKAGRRKSHDFR